MIEQGEIERAIARYNDRKDAIKEGLGGNLEVRDMGEENMRLLLAGLDIDLGELDFFRRKALGAVLGVAQQNPEIPVEHLIAGTWVDGFVTGVILGEGRRGAD